MARASRPLPIGSRRNGRSCAAPRLGGVGSPGSRCGRGSSIRFLVTARRRATASRRYPDRAIVEMAAAARGTRRSRSARRRGARGPGRWRCWRGDLRRRTIELRLAPVDGIRTGPGDRARPPRRDTAARGDLPPGSGRVWRRASGPRSSSRPRRYGRTRIASCEVHAPGAIRSVSPVIRSPGACRRPPFGKGSHSPARGGPLRPPVARRPLGGTERGRGSRCVGPAQRDARCGREAARLREP